MKTVTIFIILFFTIFIVKNTSSQVKEMHYTIIKKINNIEIREYQDLVYVSYTPKNKQDKNNSFQNVAGYIFGDNNKKEKISMTSPVVIKLHKNNEMAFIMPKKYTLESLPKANNEDLSVYKEPANIKAAIRFSGYSNKQKEQAYIQELKNKLNILEIDHNNDFELLVYNSPYQFINRRNEIVVSLKDYNQNMNKKTNKTIYLGGGCFWCVEAIFEEVIGVKDVVSGYSGGIIKNPSYKEVSKGLTEHAEVCQITYDTEKISLEDILKIFFLSHNPTTLNKQGNDIGKHYRSIILYRSNDEKERINNYILSIKNLFDDQIVTEVKKFNAFYKAEEYHQNYYKENAEAPYCSVVITPKIIKAKKELSKYYLK